MLPIIALILTISLSNPSQAKIVHFDDLADYPKTYSLYNRIDTTPQPAITKSTASGTDLLYQINKEVNEEIQYKDDESGNDYWQSPLETFTLKTGDCEDYAVLKWYKLLKNGIPEKSMTFLLGVTEDFQFHTELQVLYNTKIYYLDNNTNNIMTSLIKPLGAFTINRFGVNIYME